MSEVKNCKCGTAIDPKSEDQEYCSSYCYYLDHVTTKPCTCDKPEAISDVFLFNCKNCFGVIVKAKEEYNKFTTQEWKIDLNNKDHYRIYEMFAKINGIRETIGDLSSMKFDLQQEVWEWVRHVFPDTVGKPLTWSTKGLKITTRDLTKREKAFAYLKDAFDES